MHHELSILRKTAYGLQYIQDEGHQHGTDDEQEWDRICYILCSKVLKFTEWMEELKGECDDWVPTALLPLDPPPRGSNADDLWKQKSSVAPLVSESLS